MKGNMALDESSLEEMIRRQKAANTGDEQPTPSRVTEENEEFEVYERDDGVPQQEPQPPRATAPQQPQPPRATAPQQPQPPRATAPQQPTPQQATPEPQVRPQEQGVSPQPQQAPGAESRTIGAQTSAPQQTSGHAGQTQSEQHDPQAANPPQPRQATPTEGQPSPQPSQASPPPGDPPRPRDPERADPPPQQTPREEQDAMANPRIAILQSEFNYDITAMMATLARQQAEHLGCSVTHHVSAPGVYDIPLLAKALATRADVDAIVAIGVVIQGETDHDSIVTQHATRKLADLAFDTGKPVGLAITGPKMSRLQAEARIGVAKNAVDSVVKQFRTLGQIQN